MPRKSKSPKPCPPGKERNPATGRCRNVKSPNIKKVKSPKPCPPGKERNPSTGRCRNVKSPNIKKVKSPKPCPPGKERNPSTGRCRNVKSPTSKKNEKDRSSLKNKSPKNPRKSPPKNKSSPRKSPTNSDEKPKKVKKAVPDYIKYGIVKIDFGIKGPDPIYFPRSRCIIDSAVSWPNPKVPGSSRDKYNELIKRGKELGYYDFWLTKDYFTRSRSIRPIDNIDLTNIKTVTMYIPSGMMVKIWTWDNDAPRVFKAGTYTDQSIVGSTGNGLCMIWGGHESQSDDIPDSFRMK
jgi:hypothetical protein